MAHRQQTSVTPIDELRVLIKIARGQTGTS
jgi:hypothetical protein